MIFAECRLNYHAPLLTQQEKTISRYTKESNGQSCIPYIVDKISKVHNMGSLWIVPPILHDVVQLLDRPTMGIATPTFLMCETVVQMILP